MPIINRIAEFADDMKTWRHHIHANPELGFDCHNTAAFVCARLKEFGVDEIHDGIATSGVIAIINGNGGDGPVIGLRADMDALPIQEAVERPHKSTIAGKMHACGHDGHTTMLLGAAKYLAETRNFKGKVALIFQPAEEGHGGGRAMCEEGVMARFDIQQVYAIHNWPDQPLGSFAMRAGPIMAAADRFTVSITGHGGHAAMPQNARDPIPATVALINAFNTIVSRNVDPLDQAVLSVTTIRAGDAFNIIPETATISGTVRTFDKKTKARIVSRMQAIVDNIANAYDVDATLDYMDGYPPTVNHTDAVTFAADVARGIAGADMVDENPKPSMGGEDFSYMLEQRPGAYVFLGQGESMGLHHPEYDFKDEIAPIGASFLVKLVENAQPA